VLVSCQSSVASSTECLGMVVVTPAWRLALASSVGDPAAFIGIPLPCY
jgi:hypothetical protein